MKNLLYIIVKVEYEQKKTFIASKYIDKVYPLFVCNKSLALKIRTGLEYNRVLTITYTVDTASYSPLFYNII